MYDVIVVGAGPAGLAAAVHLSKNKLKTLVLAQNISLHTHEQVFGFINNKALLILFEQECAENKEYLQFFDKQEVIAIEKNIVSFEVETKQGKTEYARCLIIASGELNGEARNNFDHTTAKDVHGFIKVDSDMQTSVAGIFAAGDVTVGLTKDFSSSVYGAARAALSAQAWLEQKNQASV